MDRIALSKRIEGLSSVFTANTPYQLELLAMSTALNKMKDEKFASILDASYTEDAAFTGRFPGSGAGHTPVAPAYTSTKPLNVQDAHAMALKLEEMAGKPGIGEQIMSFITGKKAPVIAPVAPHSVAPVAPHSVAHTMSAEASDETLGSYWNREASEAVINNLLKDVCGMDKSTCCDTKRHLDKEQIPDASHAGLPMKPATLQTKQTPDLEKVLDSNMLAESKKTPLKREASEEKKEEKQEEKPAVVEESAKAEKEEQKVEKLEDKALDLIQEAVKVLEDAKEKEEKAEKAEHDKDATCFDFDGIELTAGMEDVELSADDADKLSKLFQ